MGATKRKLREQDETMRYSRNPGNWGETKKKARE